MKKIITILFALALFVPSVSYASTLTSSQVSAIIGLLSAFGVDQQTIDIVYKQLVFSPVAPTITSEPSFGSTMTTTSTPAPTAPASESSGTANLTPDLSAVTATLVHTAPASVADDRPFGSFLYRVSVLDSKGKNVDKAPVTMTSPNNLLGETREKTIDTTADLHSVDYYTTFEYIPTKKGAVTLSFTSGVLSTTASIIVQ